MNDQYELNEDLLRDLRRAADECKIPASMRGGLERYILQHVEPGGFLARVIANDLRGACEHADIVNRDCLYNYVQFLYGYAPSACWGSEQKLDAWLAARKEEP